MKIFIFTPIESLVSLDRPVANVFVKELKILFIGGVSKRSVKLHAYRLNKEDFWFNGQLSLFLSNLTPIHISSVEMVSNTLNLTHPRRGNINLYRVYKWLISPVRTSDTTNDRLRILASSFPSFQWRGGGGCFLHPLLNFTLSCG